MQTKAWNISYLILALALFIYAGLRVFSLPITHDEAYSFLRYVPSGYFEIFSYNTGNILPNNHILNTLGMKFFSSWLGPQDWVVRLPNLIGFAIYLWFAWKLSATLKNRLNGLFLFVGLTFIHYQIEFFALARGYGLSLAFLLPAIYFLRQYLTEQGLKNLIFSLVCVFLSIEASFTLLYLYVPLGGLLFFWGISSRNKTLIWGLVLFAVFLFLVLYEPMRFLISSGTLFGPKSAFLDHTLDSLIIMLLPEGTPSSIRAYLMYLVIALFAFGTLLAVRLAWLKRSKESIWFLLIAGTLFLTVYLQIIGAAVFDRNLLSFRTALYYYPLFFYFLALVWQEILGMAEEKRALQFSSLLVVPILALAFNLLTQMQLNFVREWTYDQDSRDVYQSFGELAKDNKTTPLSIGISWILEPSLNFYHHADPQPAMHPFNRDGLSESDDYYYIIDADTNLLPNGTRLIKQFPESGNRLYQNMRK